MTHSSSDFGALDSAAATIKHHASAVNGAAADYAVRQSRGAQVAGPALSTIERMPHLDVKFKPARTDGQAPFLLQPRSTVPFYHLMARLEDSYPEWFEQLNSAGGSYASIDALQALEKTAPTDYLAGMIGGMLSVRRDIPAAF